MFNRKLKREIEQKDHKIASLENDIEYLRTMIEHIQNRIQNEPEDCKRGPWCHACSFNKVIHVDMKYRPAYTPTYFERVEYCGKNEACEHFTKKVVVEVCKESNNV